jgi:mannose-6-phosphate isomerase-like protein (cupin superfamily)
MSNAYWLLGNLAIVHLSGDETEGRYCLVEFQSPADEWTPLHVHRHDSQATYVLEGEITFYVGADSRTLGPGECIYHPAAVPQTEHIVSAQPARMLDVNSPAGFERFIAAAGQPAGGLTLPPPPNEPPDLERIAALANEHGLDILGPPGALPKG